MVRVGLACIALALAAPAARADSVDDLYRALGVTVARDDVIARAVRGPDRATLYAADALAPGVGVGGYRPDCGDPPNTADFGLRTADGGFQRIGRASSWKLDGLTSLAGAPVTGAGREAVLLYRRHCGTQSATGYDIEPLRRLRLLRAPFGLRPANPIALTENAEPYGATVAANPQGDLAVAWYEPEGREPGIDLHDELHLRLGSMNGPLGPDLHVSRPGRPSHDYRLGWATDRTLVLAYGDGQQQRLRLARSGRLAAPRVLGQQPKGYADVCLGEHQPGGAAAVIWNAVAYGDAPQRAWSYSLVTRPARARTFSPPVRLSSGTGTDFYARTGQDCQVLNDGRIVAAWETPLDPWPVSAAILGPHDNRARPQVISPDSAKYSVRVPPSGQPIVQWEVHDNPQLELESPAGATGVFGTPTFAPDRYPRADGIYLVDSRTGG